MPASASDSVGGDEHRFDWQQRVLVAVDEQQRRRLAAAVFRPRLSQIFGANLSMPEKLRIAAGARARLRPTCIAIIAPWLKPTRASAD